MRVVKRKSSALCTKIWTLSLLSLISTSEQMSPWLLMGQTCSRRWSRGPPNNRRIRSRQPSKPLSSISRGQCRLGASRQARAAQSKGSSQSSLVEKARNVCSKSLISWSEAYQPFNPRRSRNHRSFPRTRFKCFSKSSNSRKTVEVAPTNRSSTGAAFHRRTLRP